MRYQALNNFAVPADTAQVAHAAFPKGNVYLTVRDALGPLYQDSRFAPLFSHCGQGALSPALLAVVCVAQYAEGLSDVQAAEAVRSRIDWKYLLALPLQHPGFDASVLTEFRARLLEGSLEAALLEDLVARFLQAGWLKPTGRQRTDATHVLAAVRQINRLELVGETLRHALEVLAVVAPRWLRQRVTPDWFERYGQRFEQYRLPSRTSEWQALVLQIGADGYYLYQQLQAPDAPPAVQGLEAVEILRQVWLQQFYYEAEQVCWRAAGNLPPAAQLIKSPYDVEARYSQKREWSWIGYTVHVTESCEADQPHLITHIHTTQAGPRDHESLDTIQAALQAQGLTPHEHLVDAGYVTAPLLVHSQARQIDLLGPLVEDVSWQARAGTGFAAADFVLDGDAQQATCPGGQTSSSWEPRLDQQNNATIDIRFATATCAPCPLRAACTTSQSGRKVRVRPQAEYEARRAARARQQEPAFAARYRLRNGIEGTLSLAVRSFDLRRTRYRGLAKTHLGHLLTAAALNLTRIAYWLQERTRATTRRSHFARLADLPLAA